MGASGSLLLNSCPLRTFLKGHHRQQGSRLLCISDLPRPVPHYKVARIAQVEGVMTNEWMKTRQTRYGAYLSIYILVILAVIIAANWLANRHNKTVDVTSNKRFTLSDQTTK